jgi:hypothetical protein
MTDQQFQQLVELLGKIGTFAYDAALRQVYVDGWRNLIMGAVFLFAAIVFAKVCIRAARHLIDSPDEDMWIMASLFTGIFSAGILIASVASLNSAFVLLLSPQWNALRHMASLVR